MKKIITVLVLSIFTSCFHIHEGDIITGKTYNKGWNAAEYMTEASKFYADKNRYEVGDTIKFKK